MRYTLLLALKKFTGSEGYNGKKDRWHCLVEFFRIKDGDGNVEASGEVSVSVNGCENSNPNPDMCYNYNWGLYRQLYNCTVL